MLENFRGRPQDPLNGLGDIFFLGGGRIKVFSVVPTNLSKKSVSDPLNFEVEVDPDPT